MADHQLAQVNLATVRAPLDTPELAGFVLGTELIIWVALGGRGTLWGPLIGTILTGGEGQGLLAANYRMSGPAADPQVSVNPLSALAPGFLRQLFQYALPPAQAQQQPATVLPAQQ